MNDAIWTWAMKTPEHGCPLAVNSCPVVPLWHQMMSYDMTECMCTGQPVCNSENHIFQAGDLDLHIDLLKDLRITEMSQSILPPNCGSVRQIIHPWGGSQTERDLRTSRWKKGVDTQMRNLLGWSHDHGPKATTTNIQGGGQKSCSFVCDPLFSTTRTYIDGTDVIPWTERPVNGKRDVESWPLPVLYKPKRHSREYKHNFKNTVKRPIKAPFQ